MTVMEPYRHVLLMVIVTLTASVAYSIIPTIVKLAGVNGVAYIVLLSTLLLSVGLAGLAVWGRPYIGGLQGAWIGFVSAAVLILYLYGLGGLAFGFSRSPGVAGGPLSAALITSIWLSHAVIIYGVSVKGAWRSAGDANYAALLSGLSASVILAAPSIYPELAVEEVFTRISMGYGLGASAAYIYSVAGGSGSLLFLAASTLALSLIPFTPSGGYIGYSLLLLTASMVAAGTALLLSGYGSRRIAIAVALASAVPLAVGLFYHTTGIMIWQPIVVATGSMEPSIPKGSIVVIQSAELGDIEEGDIIVYRDPGGVMVTHRVVEKGEGFLVTKGDANDSPDPYRVTGDMIIGRVIAVIPYVGWPLILVSQQPLLKIGLTIAAAAAMIYLILKE